MGAFSDDNYDFLKNLSGVQGTALNHSRARSLPLTTTFSSLVGEAWPPYGTAIGAGAEGM